MSTNLRLWPIVLELNLPILRPVFADRVLGHEKYSMKLILVDAPGFDDANKTKQIINKWTMSGTFVGLK
jgi:hypothetical protein